jgi:hypothetical protein
VFQFVRFGCFVEGFDYYGSLLGQTLTPIAICLALNLYGWLKKGTVQRDMQNLCLFVLYTVLPSVTLAIFDVTSCESFGEGSIRTTLLSADYSVVCDTPRYWAYYYYGAAMFALYPIGVPLLYTYVLIRQRKRIAVPIERRKYDERIQKLSFLFMSYKPEFWWFEIFVTFSRLALTGLLSIIEPGSIKQLAAGLFMTLVVIILMCIFTPYNSARDNIMSIICGFEIFMVIMVALILKAKRDSIPTGIGFDSTEYVESLEETRLYWGNTLIILNALNMFVFFVWVSHALYWKYASDASKKKLYEWQSGRKLAGYLDRQAERTRIEKGSTRNLLPVEGLKKMGSAAFVRLGSIRDAKIGPTPPSSRSSPGAADREREIAGSKPALFFHSEGVDGERGADSIGELKTMNDALGKLEVEQARALANFAIDVSPGNATPLELSSVARNLANGKETHPSSPESNATTVVGGVESTRLAPDAPAAPAPVAAAECIPHGRARRRSSIAFEALSGQSAVVEGGEPRIMLGKFGSWD